METVITKNAKETKKLGEMLAQEILVESRRKGSTFETKKETPRSNLGRAMIICLSGDLGSGKTTFAQGFLKGLGAKGPYTSPTFVVMKHYKSKIRNPKSEIRKKSKILNIKCHIQNIYHIDAYRVNARDLLNLGWEEIIAEKNNVIIVEWADRIKKIVPKNSLWIKFEWAGLPRIDKRHARIEANEENRKMTLTRGDPWA